MLQGGMTLYMYMYLAKNGENISQVSYPSHDHLKPTKVVSVCVWISYA